MSHCRMASKRQPMALAEKLADFLAQMLETYAKCGVLEQVLTSSVISSKSLSSWPPLDRLLALKQDHVAEDAFLDSWQAIFQITRGVCAWNVKGDDNISKPWSVKEPYEELLLVSTVWW